jgi:sugar (pentulose or hexulose) kinase
MPLYLGLDASTRGLIAIVIEIERDLRRVVFNRTIDFDRDMAHYGTTRGVRSTTDGDIPPSPMMWADALDRMLGRLGAAAEIEVERIGAISGAAHLADGALYQHLPDEKSLDSSAALVKQLQPASPIARRFDSLASYFEAMITGHDHRLSPYWRKRFALPAATIVPWSDEHTAIAIGTGVIRDRVVAVCLGESDLVIACATDAAPAMSLLTFRNGSRARELVRLEHDLSWDDIARMLEQSPGNTGCLMLPWVETETTPPITHAGVRRFGFGRHDAGRNVRGLIEGQMMAMANHAAGHCGVPIEKIVAVGDAAIDRAILQVMANVFGADVYRLDAEHSAALGAALRAYHADRLAAGEPVTWKTAVSGFTDPKPGHRVSPNPRHVALYRELRKDYAMLERLHLDRSPIC